MSGVRVLEVDELGRDAVIVRVDGEKLVFIDGGLDHDARMSVLTRAMGQAFDS